MTEFWNELKRRNVVKVAVAYLALGWLVVQVTSLAVPALNLPESLNSIVFYLGMVGFPFALFLAWAYELTPDGVKPSAQVDPQQSVTPKTGQKLNWAIITLLALVSGLLLIERVFFMAHSGETQWQGGNSIAVLPFVDMSAEQNQAHLGDGIAEEILNLLAREEKLKVASRTSAFSFRNKAEDIRAIGQALGVETVLEGSIRSESGHVRVTAQLIAVEDGRHLWSQTYTRELESLFALQDEIAGKISIALLPRIMGDYDSPASPIQPQYQPTADQYQRYLMARSLFNKTDLADLEKALELMRALVREEPKYAEAQAFLATVLLGAASRNRGELPWVEVEPQVRRAIEAALQLNPELAEAYNAKADLLGVSDRMSREPKALMEKAVALAPSDSNYLIKLAYMKIGSGEIESAWPLLERAIQLDPVSPQLLDKAAHAYYANEKYDRAEELIAVLEQLDAEQASWARFNFWLDRRELARALLELERHERRWPESRQQQISWRKYHLLLNLGFDDRAGLDLGVGSRSSLYYALKGEPDKALQLMREYAPQAEDPHDRADVYWKTYYHLGLYEEALSELDDLWHGYAERTVGFKMDLGDVFVYGELLSMLGRQKEADEIAEIFRSETDFGIHAKDFYKWTRFAYLIIKGDKSAGMAMLGDWVNEGWFQLRLGKPFWGIVILNSEPGFTDFVEQAKRYQQQQRELYFQLKEQQGV